MKTYDHIKEKLNQDGDYFNAKIHRRYLPSMYVRDVLKGRIEKDLIPMADLMRKYKGYFPKIFQNSTCKKALINVLRMYKLIDNTHSSSRYAVVRRIYTDEVFEAFCEYFGIESMQVIPTSVQRDKHSFLTEDEHTYSKESKQSKVDHFIKTWVHKNARAPLYRADGTARYLKDGSGFVWCRQGELRHFEIIVKAYRRYGAYITAKYFKCLGDRAGVSVADLMPDFESEDMDVFDRACDKLNSRIRDVFSGRMPSDIVAQMDVTLRNSGSSMQTSFFS